MNRILFGWIFVRIGLTLCTKTQISIASANLKIKIALMRANYRESQRSVGGKAFVWFSKSLFSNYRKVFILFFEALYLQSRASTHISSCLYPIFFVGRSGMFMGFIFVLDGLDECSSWASLCFFGGTSIEILFFNFVKIISVLYPNNEENHISLYDIRQRNYKHLYTRPWIIIKELRVCFCC